MKTTPIENIVCIGVVYGQRLVSEVINGSKKSRRDSKRHADHHRKPRASIAGNEECEDHKQQCCEDSANNKGTATLMVYGCRLCVFMK